MFTFITTALCCFVVCGTVIYILWPWRQVRVDGIYEYYYSELNNRVDTLIQEYSIPRFDYEDIVQEKRITTTEYNELVKKTYVYIMDLVPSYIKRNLYRYLDQEEVENLVLYKINKVYQNHYAGFVYEPSDFLVDESQGIVDQAINVENKII